MGKLNMAQNSVSLTEIDYIWQKCTLYIIGPRTRNQNLVKFGDDLWYLQLYLLAPENPWLFWPTL